MSASLNPLAERNADIVRHAYDLGDGDISGVHFGPQDTPVRLVFLHANGFNGLAYRSILDNLGVHVVALDLRGHGHTTLPAKVDSFATFDTYANDVLDFIKTHIGHSVVLAGHSLGASAAILAHYAGGKWVERVLAFDAVVLPVAARAMMRFGPSRRYVQKTYPLAKSAGRRRADFDSYEAAFARYRGKGPFKGFPDIALWDYVCGGFLPTEDGVTLACRPQWEQFTYTAQSHNLIRPITRLPNGSRLIQTDFVKTNPRWMEKAMRKNPGLRITHDPEMNHFFPLINPEISVPALQAVVQDGGEAKP